MGIKDQERLEALRKRLYERGKPTTTTPSHTLTDKKEEVPKTWTKPPEPKKPLPVTAEAKNAEDGANDTLYGMKKKRGYRIKMVIIGILFFVISVALSSIFLIGGGNTISGENISIAVNAPFTVGGGEAIPIQVGITNNNAVAIQSATLIVEYPEGTQSVSESGKELFIERLSLETINSGETLNIPLRALVFGEENDEKEIKVSVEYRVQGSNALFFKDVEPHRFKISSSPVSLNTVNTIKISSGQETEITLNVTSNSPTTLTDVLVKADFPSSFDFSKSDPQPTYGQNMWLITDLDPEETETITITGVLIGRESDEYAVNLTVGIPGEREPQNLASVFATDRIDFIIEQPFLDINLRIAGQSGPEIVIDPGEQAGGVIEITNTLEDTIYDASIIVTLSGNALSEVDVDAQQGGFYNSSNNTITWDVGNMSQLEQITPGETERVTFSLEPSDGVNRTPQIDVDVAVSARRVSENRVAEKLNGAASAVVKVVSIPVLRADVGHNNSVFSDSGAIPPIAEEATTYTVSFMIENGSNEITESEVTASLPPYVTYLDNTAGSGSLSFNSTNRVITWRVGSVEANASEFTSFQISFLPSQSQIGTTPTLVGEQRLKATDRFTGSVVRDASSALTTELSSESGFDSNNGVVQAQE